MNDNEFAIDSNKSITNSIYINQTSNSSNSSDISTIEQNENDRLSKQQNI
jgi:hypothetical protein